MSANDDLRGLTDAFDHIASKAAWAQPDQAMMKRIELVRAALSRVPVAGEAVAYLPTHLLVTMAAETDETQYHGVVVSNSAGHGLTPVYAAPPSPPVASHPDDFAVDAFAVAMKAKLAKKRAEGRSGWNDPSVCTVDYLANLLLHHVPKGDPTDIANIAMMIFHREGADALRSIARWKAGEPSHEVSTPPADDARDAAIDALSALVDRYVANRGTEHEFVAMVGGGPPTKKLWDAATRALAAMTADQAKGKP
jgi:hypothetical protein